MPGKHAPASPKSFYLSLARSGSGVAVVVALIVLVAVFAVRSGGEPEPKRASTATGAPTGAPTAEATVRPTLSPEQSPGPEATVSVLNGTTRAGIARRTADRVRKAGYTVVRVGNTTPRDTSTIFYALGAREAALALQKDFPEFGALEEATPAQAREATLTLIIGADFP
jgi:hypothetical protein